MAKNNKVNFEEYHAQIKIAYGEEVFTDAVSSLVNEELLIECQYPFLNDASMRERNFGVQKEIFKKYGYSNVDSIILGAFEVPKEGWMHCFYILGGKFNSPKEVKLKVISFFNNNLLKF